MCPVSSLRFHYDRLVLYSEFVPAASGQRTGYKEKQMQTQPISPNTQVEQYQLFILRVWRDRPEGPQRFMLKAADGHHRYLFADVHDLADFLEKTAPEGEKETL
jgi:hypothetical protein